MIRKSIRPSLTNYEISETPKENKTSQMVTCYVDGYIVSDGYLDVFMENNNGFNPHWFMYKVHRHLQLTKEVLSGLVEEVMCIVAFREIEKFAWELYRIHHISGTMPYAGYHGNIERKINFMGFLSWVPDLPSYQITFPDDLLISTKNALDYAEAFRNLAAFIAYRANVVVRNRLPQVFLYLALRAETAALVRATFFSITDTEQRNDAKSELVNNKGKPCESLSVFGITTPLSKVWLKPSYLDDLFNALSI